MQKSRGIFLTVFLFLSIFIIGQPQRKIDSLQKLITKQADTTKAATLIRLSWELCSIGEYPTAQSYLKEARTIAIRTNFKVAIANCDYMNGVIEMNQSNYAKAVQFFISAEKQFATLDKRSNLTSSYNALGVAYFRQGDFEKSMVYYNKALKMNEEMSNRSGIATSLTNISGIYFIQGKIPEALDYSFRSLKIEREIGNKKGIAASLTTIGIMYHDMREYEKALTFYDQSLNICKEENNKAGIANCLVNIASTYLVLPDSIVGNKKAMENYQKCLPLFEALGDKSGASTCLAGIGAVYGKTGQYKKAIPIILRAIKMEREINDITSLGSNSSVLAKIYIHNKEPDKALEYCDISLQIAKATGNIIAQMTAEKNFTDAYLAKNDANLAMKHYQRQVTLKDSIYNIEGEKNINEVEQKYETAIKEKENKELNLVNTVQTLQLNKNRYFIFGLSALLLMCLIVAYVIIKQNKLKHKQQSIVLEQKLLRSQMNPHFIFNALNAIESFIYKNEPKEAGSYLSGFARLMRLILENSREEYVTLEKEIQTLEHYLNLQKLRFDNSFSYVINIGPNIDASAISIPPMLAQPFIENSIEHGLKNISRKGEITLNFYLQNNELIFESCDNGIGFERSMQIKSESTGHRSMATTITLERLKNLNRNKSKKIKWVTEDIKDQINSVIGARVVFTIPFKEI